MKIREFKIDDYQTVRDLWRTAGLTLRPGDELEDVKLKLQRDPDLFLVAEASEQGLYVKSKSVLSPRGQRR